MPVAYIQRITVKSILTLPEPHAGKENLSYKKLLNESSIHEESHQLYLIDVFRAVISQSFEINQFLRNFRTDGPDEQSLINDACVHVGELKNSGASKSYLPEFSCLYLSPANFWSNDLNAFTRDEHIMKAINELNEADSDNSTLNDDTEGQNKDFMWRINFFPSLFNRLMTLLNRLDFSKKTLLNKQTSTRQTELLFGVSWNSILNPVVNTADLVAQLRRLNYFDAAKVNKTIVFTYAITIALKNYNKLFISQLDQALQARFAHLHVNSSEPSDQIVNLQYTSQSIVYYIPFIMLYFLLFLYIYISVSKIEFVKSKWGLALAAVSQVVASLLMSIGICSFFGLTPTLNGGEIFPYLIIFIGFENIVVLTKSVVSTPIDLDVRYRIALGLKKESWLITKILTFELIIICSGILTLVPAITEFCVFAYVGLLIDFFMQMIFFVTVLSIDIRRMELSDLKRQHTDRLKQQINVKNQNYENNSKYEDLIGNSDLGSSLTYRGKLKP